MSDTVKLDISTRSQVIHYQQPWPKADPPIVKINGKVLQPPSKGPFAPTGYRIVIFDATKPLNDSDAVLADQYVTLWSAFDSNSWMSTYQSWYDTSLLRAVLLEGNVDHQTRVFASFGLDVNMAPTPEALELMFGCGAGEKLQHWEKTVDVGSQVSNSTSWVSFPGSYILVGSSRWPYGRGFEAYKDEAGDLGLSVSIPVP